jgi:[lysine-biosynthesis-protein LysW]--L-2-aminoadipate ligase
MRLGILHTGIRGDEKLIIESAKKNNLDFELIDLREKLLDPTNLEFWNQFDVILERCISTEKGNAAIDFLSTVGMNILNTSEVKNNCDDKFQTATVLENAGVPVAKSILSFSEASAKEAVENLGDYPIVLKSRSGSWGRLIAKVNDEDALESILEHKQQLGPHHQPVIVQDFIEKPERDIRAFVIGQKCIAAIYRESNHWITNTARGGEAKNCPITPELQKICRQTANAIGEGLLALDIFETDSGFIVNEVNHTMEFKNSEEPTGVSISSEIINYCINSVTE